MFTLSSIVLSAAFLTLSFPSLDLPYLAWGALVPLLLLIKHASPFRAFGSALAVGVLFHCGLEWWTLRIHGANIFNFGLGTIGLACYFGLFGLVGAYFQKTIPKWNVLTLPATWVLLEYLRSHLDFLSFPWGLLGYSQYSVLPVAQISAFAGVYGVSFCIVAGNTLLAEVLHPSLSRFSLKIPRVASPAGQEAPAGLLAGAGMVLLALVLSGFWSLPEPADRRSLKVAVVQGNVSIEEGANPASRRAVFERYQRLTRRAASSSPDLIVWPSSSVPGRIPSDAMLVRLLSSLAKEANTFLLIGSAGFDKFNIDERKEPRVSNSAFLLSPKGRFIGRYDKIRLLPFDEYIPLRGYVSWPSWIVSDMLDHESGTRLTIFNMNGVRFGVLICWENLFPDLFREMAARGVEFMVSMTNEAFIDHPEGHYQMLAMNVFRAVENGVAIVRTASTGVSGFIDPTGRIIGRVRDQDSNDVSVEGYLLREIPLVSNRTLYNRYGDWFIYFLGLMLSGFVSLAVLGNRHSTRATDAAGTGPSPAPGPAGSYQP